MADTGDVEISEVIRNGLHEVLAKELNSEKIDVNIEMGSKKGDNFVGIVYRVNAKLAAETTNGKTNENKSSIDVILKVAPTNKPRREQFCSRHFFLREIKMYDEVLPMFRRFQESKGVIPEENGFHEYPKCYKTIDAEVDETLIFQDLKADHFEMFDRRQEIGADHVRLIMNALGKFHALSFALRDQQPEELKRFSQLEENFLRNSDEAVITYLKSLTVSVCNALDQDGDERLREKAKEFFEAGHLTIFRKCCDNTSAEPYAVISHGDCWNNNMLFKYDENKKPVDVRLLDWQISRYSSPVLDLVYYIFCCTTKPIRDQCYDELIKTYHTSLSKMLTRMGSDPAKLFPFDALQEQLRQYGKFGLLTASMLLPVVTMDPDNCPDLDELAETFEKDGTYDENLFAPDKTVYNKRMRDVVIDMERLGYF